MSVDKMITWLVNLRKSKQLTQTQVAKLCGFTGKTYNHYERGRRRISVDKAQIIANVLEVDWTLFYPNHNNPTTA